MPAIYLGSDQLPQPLDLLFLIFLLLLHIQSVPNKFSELVLDIRLLTEYTIQ
jgi:hypothetical protein